MRSVPLVFACVTFALFWPLERSSVAAEVPRVHLEIAAEKVGTLEGPQQWVRTLQGLPLASVRIRASMPNDRPKIEEAGTADAPAYRVLGLLTAGNDLLLPGAKVRSGDRAGVERWLANLGAESSNSSNADGAGREAGVDPKKLEAAIQLLSSTVVQATRDRPLQDVVQDIDDQLKLGLTDDPDVRHWLASGPAVQDELKGLSAGTALAAVLQPAGLDLVFQADAARPAFRISQRTADNTWPIGWASTLPPPKLTPKLFDKLEVEMKDTPFRRATEALQERLQLPLVYDHAALRERQIDLDQIKVRFPRKRVSYFTVIKNLLFQARLQMEVRLDEADHPFLYVTPLKVD